MLAVVAVGVGEAGRLAVGARASAPVIEQVATPAVRSVVELHAEPLKATLPAGVPPGPLTVAVKTKVPPVVVLDALSLTTVAEEAAAGETGPSERRARCSCRRCR